MSFTRQAIVHRIKHWTPGVHITDNANGQGKVRLYNIQFNMSGTHKSSICTAVYAYYEVHCGFGKSCHGILIFKHLHWSVLLCKKKKKLGLVNDRGEGYTEYTLHQSCVGLCSSKSALKASE